MIQQRKIRAFSAGSGDRAPTLYEGLAEHVAVGLYLIEDDHFRYVNTRLAQMLGYSREELVGLSLYDIVAHDERQRVAETLRQTLTGDRRGIHYERKARRKDGTFIDVEIFGSRLEGGDDWLIAGVMIDVTSRKQDETMAELTSLVYEHSRDAMVVTDANGVIITVNPAFTDITGYGLDEVVGRRMNLLSSGKHDKDFFQGMWDSIQSTGRWEGEIWNRRKNAEEYVERLSITTTYNDDGTVRCRVGMFSDITEKKRHDERIWHQAHYDHLTGLPNRLMLQQGLEAKMLYSRHTGVAFSLLYLDLDLFKEINDTLGHVQGDELLRQVAARLLGCVRRSDLVARLGGDEFCVIADAVSSEEEVRRLCEKIVRVVAEPYLLGEDLGLISVSIGVAFYPRDAESADELIHHADMAMYAAKSQGRNCFSVFAPGMRKEVGERRRLVRDLAGALEQNQFLLYYQPIFNLRTGQVVKAEALLRWQHPRNGLLSPIHFMQEAEETGLIVDIGNWVFREAAIQAARWRAQRPGFQMAVNFSEAQFANHDLHPADFLEILQRLNLPVDAMMVEITERLLMDVSPDIGDKLLAFADSGIQLALDDFGTGFSSLPYMLRYRIGCLKIDMSFVRNIERSAQDRHLCEAIILMARKLGLSVIAEGVTTPGQRTALLEAGCDFAQGFLYSAPVPATTFEQLFDVLPE
ncbi:putative bifunctional diguanylate cyclase/phosphodiesterase [Pusillimonas sp.]|uniref:putative bifunctional diguanylate cyclase/phosphodiesterase n=1 Tax=Pusillimonas sp. TaxID=3040095 RepID=UPI0037C61BCF